MRNIECDLPARLRRYFGGAPAAISPAILAKSGGLWYNISMTIKKATKTVNIKKPEHRKTAAKPALKKLAVKHKTVNNQSADNDNAWKEILDEHYFPKFMAFYFPKTYRIINFNRPIEFLDKEFQKIGIIGEVGNKRVDKLVKVFLKDGTEKWLLVHVEIQAAYEKDFEERLYIYNYRIFDRYHKNVITLVILTDDNKKFRPEKYEVKYPDTALTLKFGTRKLLDYRPQIAKLEKDKNPFAVITLTYLRLMEAKNDNAKKYFWKFTLIKSLYRKGYSKEDVRQLYKFIDWIVTLPVDLEKKLVYEIKESEEEKAMPIITSAEKIGAAKERAKRDKIIKNLRKLGVSEDKIKEAIRMAEKEAA